MSTVFLYIIASILLTFISRMISKKVLRTVDPYSYSYLIQIIGCIMFFVMALFSFKLTTNLYAWMIALMAGIVWSGASVAAAFSYKNNDISIAEPLSQIKILFVLMIGIFFLGESLALNKILGTFIMFFGLCLIVYHPERKLKHLNSKPILSILLASFLTSVAVTLDKIALSYFNAETYIFITYLIPFLVLSAFLPKKHKDFKHLIQTKFKSAATAIVFGAIAFYCVLKAYSMAELTLVYPFMQLVVLLSVIGSFFFLEEKDNLGQKVIASLFIIIGAILLKLAF